MKRLVVLRRSFQAVSFAIFAATFLAALNYSKGLIPPGILFRIDPLITLVMSIAGRSVAPGVFVSAFMLVFAVVSGRLFCGWMCPLGAMQDAIGFIIRKKPEKNIPFGAPGRAVKFFVLAAVLAITAIAGTGGAMIADPLVMMSNLITLNLALPNALMLLAAAAPVFFVRRFWCRFLCPLGALYAIPALAAPFRRVVAKGGCNSCGACYRDCRMGAIRKDASYVKHECVLCMDCIYSCSTHATRFGWR